MAKPPSLDQISSVYGPVRSWRVGSSLGIDMLCVGSICSFNCSYCQLGSIQVRTRDRRLFVPTDKLEEDLGRSRWREADVLTFSGSGEPTLAINLGEAIGLVRSICEKPVLVLTNGTLLDQRQVRQELSLADRIFLKLDAASEATLQRVNRPVPGISLEQIVSGAEALRAEYRGELGVQMMFVHATKDPIEHFAGLLRRIQPDQIQVNTPTRPYPDDWYLASRGSHEGVDYPARVIKPLDAQQLDRIARELRRLVPGVKILGVNPETRPRLS